MDLLHYLSKRLAAVSEGFDPHSFLVHELRDSGMRLRRLRARARLQHCRLRGLRSLQHGLGDVQRIRSVRLARFGFDAVV